MNIRLSVNAMKSRYIAFIAGALVCMLSAPAISQSSDLWVDIKDPNELRDLYSNKTFKGVGGDGRPFVSYYRADGKGLLISDDKRFPHTWEIKGNDQVCITEERSFVSGCRRFQRSKANRNEIHLKHESGWEALFKVEDGIPQF